MSADQEIEPEKNGIGQRQDESRGQSWIPSPFACRLLGLLALIAVPGVWLIRHDKGDLPNLLLSLGRYQLLISVWVMALWGFMFTVLIDWEKYQNPIAAIAGKFWWPVGTGALLLLPVNIFASLSPIIGPDRYAKAIESLPWNRFLLVYLLSGLLIWLGKCSTRFLNVKDNGAGRIALWLWFWFGVFFAVMLAAFNLFKSHEKLQTVVIGIIVIGTIGYSVWKFPNLKMESPEFLIAVGVLIIATISLDFTSRTDVKSMSDSVLTTNVFFLLLGIIAVVAERFRASVPAQNPDDSP